MITPFFEGHLLMWGLVLGVGPQNIFIMRAGLSRRWVPIVVGVSFLCDLMLVVAGVQLIGGVLAHDASVTQTLTNVAAHVILLYGVLAIGPLSKSPRALDGAPPHSVWSTAALAAIMSLCNPAAWFDTIVIIGGAAAHYSEKEAWSFAAGALSTSLIWFSLLGFGAGLLRSRLENPRYMKWISQVSGVLLIGTAVRLWMQ